MERETGWTSSPVVQCVAVPANRASINVRIILQSTAIHHSLCSCLSVCMCATTHYTATTSTITHSPAGPTLAIPPPPPRSLSISLVLLSALCSADYHKRHAGASAPASDCDERRPPDHHHPPPTAGRASCEQNLCRRSTTAANCLLLSTNPLTTSFLIFHHPYTLHCERGWLAAPSQPWTPAYPSPDAPSISDMKLNAHFAQCSNAVSAVQRM